MTNSENIEALVEKYEGEIKQIRSVYEEVTDSHFNHIVANSFGPMKLAVRFIKKYQDKGDLVKLSEGEAIILRNSAPWEYYVGLIKSNEEVRDLEMKTRNGYFGEFGYNPVEHIEKLKGREELK